MDYTPKPAHKGKNITLSFSANTSISISHMHWRQYCLNNTDRNITKSDEQFVLNKNETEWSLVLINWTITYCDFTVEIYTDTDNDTSQCKHKDFFLLVHTTAFDDTEDAGLPFKNASQGISNGEFTELHERSGDREEYPQSNANRDHTIKSSSKIDRNPVEVKSSQQIDNKQTIKLDEQDTLHDTDLDQPGSKNDTTLDQSGSKYDTSLVQSGSKYDTSLVQSGSPEVEPTDKPSSTSTSRIGVNDEGNLFTDEKSKTRDKDAPRITPEQSVPASLSPNKGAPPVYVSTFLPIRPNKSATTRTTTVHMLPEVEQTDKPSPTENKEAIIGTENVHNDDFNDTTDGGRMDNKQAKTTKQEDMHRGIDPITAKYTKEGVTETPSADQTSPSLNGINTKGNLSTDEKSKTRDKDASRISKSTGPPNTSRKLRIGSTYMYDNRPGQSVPTSLSPDEDAPLVLPEVEPTDKRSPTKNQASTGTGEFSGDSDIEDEDITVSIQEAATVGSDNVEPIQTTELASDKWALIIILLTVALVIACLDAVLIALICVGKRGSASFDVSDGNSSRKDGVKLTTMRPLREVKIGSGVSEPVFSQVGRSHFSFEDESRVGTSKQMETPEITVEDNRTGIYESRETNRTVVCYSGETNPREIGTFGQGDVQQLDRVLRGF